MLIVWKYFVKGRYSSFGMWGVRKRCAAASSSLF